MNNKIELLDHQKIHYENIKKSIEKYSRAIDASDTGTGKTYVSAKLCVDLKLIPWIVCPKSVVSSWLKVIKEAGIKKFYIITYDQLMLCNDLIINNSENYDWAFESDNKFKGNEKSKYLFIYDEAHKCKNSKTINSRILQALSKYQVKILLLSATIIDKPLYFIPFGIVLKLYPSLQDGLDWMAKTINKKSSNPMLPIHNTIFNEYASRMRIDDTIGVFKNNKISFEGINMKNYWEIEQKYDKLNLLLEQNKLINKKNNKSKNNNLQNLNDSDNLNDDFYDLEINETNVDKEKNNTNSFASIQKLRQEIELLRIDTIHELTLKYIGQSKSVVIFVNFTNTIKELSKKLNCTCIIWGSQSLKERTLAINNFCSDKSRIIICNIQSGGCGISLHDTLGQFPRVSIISPTWSAQDLIQVLGRIHRAMGKTDCEQHIIFCKGTIEESVGNVIKQKIGNIRLFNDGEKKLKKDNMEVILNNELTKKKKKEEANEYIYKINDFDAIQNRIEKLEIQLDKLVKELNKYKFGSHEFKECEFRKNKIHNELEFNINKLNATINTIIN